MRPKTTVVQCTCHGYRHNATYRTTVVQCTCNGYRHNATYITTFVQCLDITLYYN